MKSKWVVVLVVSSDTRLGRAAIANANSRVEMCLPTIKAGSISRNYRQDTKEGYTLDGKQAILLAYLAEAFIHVSTCRISV